MKVTQTTVKIFASKLLTSIFGFLAIVYFARVLSSEELGVFFLFQAILIFLRTVTDFGVSRAVEKRISERQSYSRVFSTSILLKLGLWAVMSLLIIVFAGLIESYVGAKIVWELIVALAVQEFGVLGIGILRGSLRVDETAIITFGRKFVWVAGSVTLLQISSGAEAIIHAFIFSWVVQIVWVWRKIPIDLTSPSLETMMSLIDYSKYFFVDTVGSRVYSWMDLLIIGVFLSKSHVAAYETAWRVAAISFLVTSSILISVFPQISQWSAEDSTEKINGLISGLVGPSILSILPFFFGALVFSDKILGVIFGNKYVIASLALVILIFDKLLQGVYGLLGTTLQAVNRPDLSARATVVSIVTNLFFNIVLVYEFGLVGAAFATTIAATVNGILKYWYLPNYVSISLDTSHIFWGVVSSSTMVAILYILDSMINIDSVPSLIAVIGVGGVLYFVVLLSNPKVRRTFYQNVYIRIVS